MPLAVALVVIQGPALVDVGRVTAVYWPGHQAAAVTYAEMADRAGDWPGLPSVGSHPVRLIVVASPRRFDSLTRGRIPEWGHAAAVPATNTIILQTGPDAPQVLRHELAHLALHHALRRVPLWLDEGYASRAAGEWGRLDALRVNWALVLHRPPSLADVNRGLRAGRARAGAAYAFATTAVLSLERLGGDRGLEPILSALAATNDIDQALRRAYGLTLDGFEERWRRELRSRYGWLSLGSSFSIFWALVLGLTGLLWVRRRRRNRTRREALNDGWTLPDPPAS